MSKHYIRLNENSSIIKVFSTDFEQPAIGDICINEDGGRQFELNELTNPLLVNEKRIYIYKYTGGIVIEKTIDEIQFEVSLIPKPPTSELEILKEENIEIKLAMAEMIEMFSGGVV